MMPYCIFILLKQYTYSFAIMTALVLGLTVNFLTFGLLDRLSLHTLPYDQANKLVFVGLQENGHLSTSYEDAVDIRRGNASFSTVAVTQELRPTLRTEGRVSSPRTLAVGGQYFETIGLQPYLGRLLSDSDAGGRSIVISFTAWHRYFNADRRAIGSSVMLNGTAFLVVGVAPASFLDPAYDGFDRYDFWVSIDPKYAGQGGRGYNNVNLIAHLKDGASEASAKSDVLRIYGHIFDKYPGSRPTSSAAAVVVESVQRVISSGYGQELSWLYILTLVVLAAALVNSVTIQDRRLSSRMAEFALRQVVGASEADLTRQVFAESSVLVVLAIVISAIISFVALPSIAALIADDIPSVIVAQVSPTECIYVGATSVAIIVAMTLFPLFKYFGNSPAFLMRGGFGMSTTPFRKGERVLLSIELTIAMVLVLVCLVTFEALRVGEAASLGFDEKNLYVIAMPPLQATSPELIAFRLRYATRLLGLVRSLPNVTAAELAEDVPLRRGHFGSFEVGNVKNDDLVDNASIGPRFFQVMGMTMASGRPFLSSDTYTSEPVAIVNTQFVKKYLGGLDALRQELTLDRTINRVHFQKRRIVGVVDGARDNITNSPEAKIYVPMTQLSDPIYVALRLRSDAHGLASSIATMAYSIDPGVPLPTLVSFAALRQDGENRLQAVSRLLIAVGLIALWMGLLATYAGAITNFERRGKEIAIRIICGASSLEIVRTLLRSATAPLLWAIPFGLVFGILVVMYFESATGLAGFVDTTDLMFGCVASLFALVATTLIVAIMPIPHALSVAPSELLRAE